MLFSFLLHATESREDLSLIKIKFNSYCKENMKNMCEILSNCFELKFIDDLRRSNFEGLSKEMNGDYSDY